MKIISKPDYSSWKFECECSFCNTKIEGVISDIKLKKTEKRFYDDRWGESSNYIDDVFYFDCPTCEKCIEIKQWGKIPNLVLDRLRKEYIEPKKETK